MDFKTIWNLSDVTYMRLKWTVTVFLPLLTTFIGVVGKAIGYSHTDLIVTLIAAVTTLLGGLVMKSTETYNQKQQTGGDSNGSES